MNNESEVVLDSLDSDIEESQPLGNLIKIMRIHIADENVSNDEDSDETILEPQSPQLVLSQPHLHKQIESDDDTCLSSCSEDKHFPPSQVSLFSSTSLDKSSVIATTSNNKISNDYDSIDGHNDDKQIVPLNCSEKFIQKPRKRRRKKKIIWTSQRVLSQTRFSCSQSAVRSNLKKPFLKKHYVFMEEINIIESKLSSIEKLLSMRSRRYIEQADTMMQQEVAKRMEIIRKNSNERISISSSSSELDTEEEVEINQLQEVKKTRLSKVIVHQEQVMAKLKDELNKAISSGSESNSDVEASQSILSFPLRKLRSKMGIIKHRKQATKPKTKAKVSHLMDELASNSSVIYIPMMPNQTKARPGKTTVLPLVSKPLKPLFCSKNPAPARRLIGKENIVKKRSVNTSFKKSLLCSNINQSTALLDPLFSQEDETSSTGNQLHSNFSPNYSAKTGSTSLSLHKSIRFPLSQVQQFKNSSVRANQQPTTKDLSMKQLLLSDELTIRRSRTSTEETSPICLDLCTMLKLGIIALGSNCLLFTHDSCDYEGSIVGKGVILSHDYNIYPSPTTWIKSLTSKVVGRLAAYKKVLYRGTSLFDLLKNRLDNAKVESAMESQLSLSPSVPQHSNCLENIQCVGDLNSSAVNHISSRISIKGTTASFLKLKVRLVQDDEFFITTSFFDRNPSSEDELFRKLLSSSF